MKWREFILQERKTEKKKSLEDAYRINEEEENKMRIQNMLIESVFVTFRVVREVWHHLYHIIQILEIFVSHYSKEKKEGLWKSGWVSVGVSNTERESRDEIGKMLFEILLPI